MRYFIVDLFKKYPREFTKQEAVLSLLSATHIVYSIPAKILNEAIDCLEFENASELLEFFSKITTGSYSLDIHYRGIGNIFLIGEIFSKTRKYSSSDDLASYYAAIPSKIMVIDPVQYYNNAFERLKKGEKDEKTNT